MRKFFLVVVVVIANSGSWIVHGSMSPFEALGSFVSSTVSVVKDKVLIPAVNGSFLEYSESVLADILSNAEKTFNEFVAVPEKERRQSMGIVREVLYIRHSESIWNQNQNNGKKQSIQNLPREFGDSPLTTDGIKQSADLGIWINDPEVEPGPGRTAYRQGLFSCLDDSPSCLASKLGWGRDVEEIHDLASGATVGTPFTDKGSSAERLCSLEVKDIKSKVIMREEGDPPVSALRIRQIMNSIDGNNAIIAVSNLRRAIQTLMIALNYKFFFTRPTNWIIKGAHYSYPQ